MNLGRHKFLNATLKLGLRPTCPRGYAVQSSGSPLSATAFRHRDKLTSMLEEESKKTLGAEVTRETQKLS